MVDCYTGEIRFFAGRYAPEGWALCNGAVLSVNTYPALYSLIGNTYPGGDGITTFALPNLTGKVAVSAGQGTALQNRAFGQSFGVKEVTLTEANLPAHSHPVYAATHDGNTTSPQGAVYAAVPEPDGTAFINTATQTGGVVDMSINALTVSAGSNLSLDNLMPYLHGYYIIALNGLYPQRGN